MGDAEIVREALDAYNRREISAAKEYVDPELKWELSDYLLQQPGHHTVGRDEWLRLGELVFETFAESKIDVDEVIVAAPGKVVCTGTLALRMNEGDPVATAPWVRLFELRDGRIARSTTYRDRGAAIEAAKAAG